MAFLRRATFLALGPILLVACGNSDNGATADSGNDTIDEAFYVPDTGVDYGSPDDTAPVRHCTLDNGTDPVSLCNQKLLLNQWHEAAIVKGTGIAQSWDSTTFLPDQDSTGKILHSMRDDVLFTGSAARYLEAAFLYGDTEIQAQVHDDFKAFVTIVEAELTTPDPSDAELYGALRDISKELRDVSDPTNADKIDALSDALGSAIYDSLWHDLGPIVSGGDAGSDAGSDGGDAGDSGDATSPDAPADTVADTRKPDVSSETPDIPLVDGILGTPAAGGGFAYETWKAAYGAAVLMDMAARHPTDAKATSWQRAALATFDHIQRRARDATTGLVYDSLVTSTSSSSDTLTGTSPTDALLTETQAGVALALSRAQASISGTPAVFAPTVASYPYAAQAGAILEAMETVNLWDADLGGYAQGWVPSTSTLLTNKTTRGNSLMFAAIHRLNIQSSVPKSGTHLKTLRTVLTQRIPFNTSLFSVIPDQASFLVETSPSFDFTGLTDPLAKSFFTSANAVACEGLWEQLFGLPK